jgi:16S rRNA (guanine(527)-N(7))-methyltransferase RsmG
VNSAQLRDRLQVRAVRAGAPLTAPVLDQLEVYYQLLTHWNKKINLTALPLESMSDDAIDRMVVEPVAAAGVVRATAVEWFDLGSGGGSPALPIKIMRAEISLTMVESRSRKAAFLREAVRELAFRRVTVIAERFEMLSGRTDLGASVDLVTARAVRPDEAFFGLARYLLRADAELFLFLSKDAPELNSHLFDGTRTVTLIPGGAELKIFAAR